MSGTNDTLTLAAGDVERLRSLLEELHQQRPGTDGELRVLRKLSERARLALLTGAGSGGAR